MVLDIRYLRLTEQAPAPRDEVLPSTDGAASLEQLLDRAALASSPAEQARAIERLRLVIPSSEGMEKLWKILGAEGDPRRLAAIQTLGHHRQWLASRSRLKQMLEWARREPDPAAGSGLVWCLRLRNEISEFLLDERDAVAREAALGLPVNRQTLPALLAAFLAEHPLSFRSERKHLLLCKFRDLHPSLVRDLVDLLLEPGGDDTLPKIVPLFACLPQVPLFEIFLEERHLPDWNPQQEEHTVRSRAWQQLVRLVGQILEQTPSVELLRYLLTRNGEDEAFARRHGRFLRAILRQADAQVGADLISHLERITFKASEEMVARLAQLVVELSDRLEGEAGVQAASLLESWKNRSADLKLKIYQLQQGLD
jgi:hypothetical protein